jgi:putative endonuclease
MAMPYFVYILRCADDSLYTGITTSIPRRLEEHKAKKGGGYTRAHPARDIVYWAACKDRSTALKREAAIKRMPREKKLALAKIVK